MRKFNVKKFSQIQYMDVLAWLQHMYTVDHEKFFGEIFTHTLQQL